MKPAGCYTAWAYFTYCRVVIYQKYAGKKPTIQHSIDLLDGYEPTQTQGFTNDLMKLAGIGGEIHHSGC